MAVDNSLCTQSLQLHHFMCQHIVGTEETVRTKRLMNTILDNISSDDLVTNITSGSVGEGLELQGSDIDKMLVNTIIIVHEDIGNVQHYPNNINVVMEMNDTKPGFTQLRAVNCVHEIREIFEQRGNSWYLSSELYKLQFLQGLSNSCIKIIHGPFLSDKDGTIDYATCFHSPQWIHPAENWISRGHTSWPRSDVKSNIIGHGVLFVPIGSKGSVNEALEWRISFSVAEKLLVYSFSHTQLLCYALMKILLKDLINCNINCKNLLCSYFIKTIMFWVSEETTVTEWKPENLIQCFMRCFRRLLYYVEYSMCPQYFIPIINMFENKIEEQQKELLLGHLQTLFRFGWRCVLLSEQFLNFTIHSNALSSTSEMKSTQLRLFLTSYVSYFSNVDPYQMCLKYKRCILKLNRSKSSVIKLNSLRWLSFFCSWISQIIVIPSDINKTMYSRRRTQLAYLLQNINHDPVSGWLLLAAFFYKTKQYRNALYVLSYAIMKCTPEKVYNQARLSPQQLNLTTSTTLQTLGASRLIKLLTVTQVRFYEGSTLIPEELDLDCLQNYIFAPCVFAHFLCFLCHYHLNDTQQCYRSIGDIQRTIDEYYCIADLFEKGQCYILLGIALQLVGQTDLAICAFTTSNQCETFGQSTATKLLLMSLKRMNENLVK